MRASKKKRPLINERTSSIGMGLLGFDVEHARRSGWTDEQIERTWQRLTTVYRRALGYVVRAHPELYRREADGTLVYMGPVS